MMVDVADVTWFFETDAHKIHTFTADINVNCQFYVE